jgi:hypothetical protein
MRALILIAAALAIASCSNNDQVDNSQNVDENLTAENIVSNDVTAIDAVTGDASNMASDAEIDDLGNVSNEGSNLAAFPKPKPETVKPTPVQQPATNDVANAAQNSD